MPPAEHAIRPRGVTEVSTRSDRLTRFGEGVSPAQFFINKVHRIGPTVFGVAAALAETVIAVGPLGVAPGPSVRPAVLAGDWTIAEGWGGSYGAVLDTTILICTRAYP
ncbi:hypothetical protein BMS3Bbin12_01737 [bacterium BMS3Bbin12]|nr:hypothetical protein BMS3Abin12_00709 [bacterium BMS3Abin12]GBE48559.1 hypothetical protein BMS3Bbin12_01737 [bacterium BMS3Bbin12]GBE51547.1 hypothetical protein BMS3Bbin13_02509 [bacterium BMS3Bbin13]